MQIITKLLADDAVDSPKIASGAIDIDHLSSEVSDAIGITIYKASHKTVSTFTTSVATTDDVTTEVFTALTVKSPGGTASIIGAVDTTPSNKIVIHERATGDPIENINNQQVFGRLTSATTALTGSITFTNGSTAVSAVGGDFAVELSAGDWIALDADGVYYQIDSVTDADNLVLLSSYAETGGTGSASETTFLMSYFVWNTTVEAAHTMAGEIIDFKFSESSTVVNMPFDVFLNGEGFTENLAPTYPRSHILTPTAQDTLPALSYTPYADTEVALFVSGILQTYGVDYTVSGTAVTWIFAGAGFHVETTDDVWVRYRSID